MTPSTLAKSGSEHGHQRALFAWMALNKTTCPDLAWAFAIPNGGKRDAITAGKLKAEGVKAGVPDVCCLVRRRGYAGLAIELKRPTTAASTATGGKRRQRGNVGTEQSPWLEKLRSEGFAAGVCIGWEAARDVLIWYFELTGTRDE